MFSCTFQYLISVGSSDKPKPLQKIKTTHIHEIIQYLISFKACYKRTQKLQRTQEFEQLKAQYAEIIISLSLYQQKRFHALQYSLAGTNNFHSLNELFNPNGKKHILELNSIEKKESLENPTIIDLLPLTELIATFEKPRYDNSKEQAKKLFSMCNTLEESLDYLNTYYFSKKHSEKDFDTACSMLWPTQWTDNWKVTDNWDVKAWRGVAKQNHWKHLIEDTEFSTYILATANKIETSFKQAAQQAFKSSIAFSFPFIAFSDTQEFRESWNAFVQNLNDPAVDPKEISKCFQRFLMQCPTALLMQEYYKTYSKDAEKNLEAAKLFSQHKQCYILNEYLTLTPHDSDAIPDITVDERVLGFKTKYYLKKLSSDKPVAAILGLKTNCCQTLCEEYGDTMTRNAICNPDYGFYLIYKREGMEANIEKDTIVAQTWAFRSGTTLVLNSVVGLSKIAQGNVELDGHSYKNIDIWKALLRTFANIIVSDLKYRISAVLTGVDAPSTFSNLGLSGRFLQENALPQKHNCKDQAELAMRGIPLYALYVLSQNTPLKQQDEKISKETLCQYMNSEGFNGLCSYMENCTPDAYALSVMHTLYMFFEEMTPQGNEDVQFLNKKQKMLSIFQERFTGKEMENWLCASMYTPLTHFKWWVQTYNIPIEGRWSGMKTTLHIALYPHFRAFPHCNYDVFEYLVKSLSTELFYVRDKESHTPLIMCDLKSLQCMIEAQCDLFHKNHVDDGKSPLLSAAYHARNYNSWDIVRYLLSEMGTRLIQEDPGQLNDFLALTTECQQKEIVETLIINRWVPWKHLSDKNLITLVGYLDVKHEHGKTVLHELLLDAMITNHNAVIRTQAFQTAERLLGAGINLNVQNDRGYTALHLMANIKNLHPLILKCNLQQTALDLPTVDGDTALHFLAKNKQWDYLKHLVTQGASFDLKNYDGQSVLDIVKKIGKTEIVEWLKNVQNVQLDVEGVDMLSIRLEHSPKPGN